jgi:FMN-dependent oxidoreductase (nitrilotriacetate monooxygenase family)
VLRDKENGRFADPDKIHRITHKGRWYDVDAVHLCEPSPQRTPVLFQAGASGRGREFAARHAECVFISGLTKPMTAKIVADLRQRAAAYGRDPDSLIIFAGLCAIVAPTDAEAQEKFEDYKRHVSIEGTLALFGGYSGIDFSGYDFDLPMRYFESNAIQTFVEGFTSADPDREWTLREVAQFLGVGGFAPIEVGSPKTLADAMEAWVEETGIDGFNLLYSVTPGDFTDIVDLLVPELQRRGRYKTEYAPGTLREKLFGAGIRHLQPNHPGTGYRSRPPVTE